MISQLPAENSGQKYLLVDASRGDDCGWSYLWAARGRPDVRTAFANLVVPQCPLLSTERADSIVSTCGVQAPAGSAWVNLRVELLQYLSPNGAINEASLKSSLKACVDIGEEIHDKRSWPTPDAEHDSWLNRRLGIFVSGFGDILRAKALSPTDHGSLRFLNQLMLFVRATLQSHSRQIANRIDPLPAISLSDPSHTLPSGGIRDDWRRRWQSAVTATQVRHRNLLVLSPWSVFPSAEKADFRYAELLPLLRHADACAFERNVSIEHWNLNEFKCFHQRAQAVLRQRGAMSLIADSV